MTLQPTWRGRMSGRDPQEAHRASTPLELFFDLCFVVAIGAAAVELAHGLETDHTAAAIPGYLMVFFAIWWAWMNFTWFASAYDTDDVPYRLLTLVQMAGVLVLAAGVPAALNNYDFAQVTVGYLVMRVPLVVQWLRAAREDPVGRAAALRYAGGIALVQVGWLLRLLLGHPWDLAGFAVLVVAELAVPIYAEARGRATRWHPGHITERYGLFTIIVLGEAIVGTTPAFGAAASGHGLSIDLLALGVGGLLLIFGLWWTYFVCTDDDSLDSLRTAMTWGYGHFLVFAAIAALGAGLEVTATAAEHHDNSPATTLSVAVPSGLFLAILVALRRLTWLQGTRPLGLTGLAVVLLLAATLLAPVAGVGIAVLAMGVVVSVLLALFLRGARNA